MQTPLLPTSETEGEEEDELVRDEDLKKTSLNISFRDRSGEKVRREAKEVKTPERCSDRTSERGSPLALSPEVVSLLVKESQELRTQLTGQAERNSHQMACFQSMMTTQNEAFAQARESWEQERRELAETAESKAKEAAAAAVAAKEAAEAEDWNKWQEPQWEATLASIPAFPTLDPNASTPPDTPRTRKVLWESYKAGCRRDSQRGKAIRRKPQVIRRVRVARRGTGKTVWTSDCGGWDRGGAEDRNHKGS